MGWGNYKFFVLLLMWGLATTSTVLMVWAPLFVGLWQPLVMVGDGDLASAGRSLPSAQPAAFSQAHLDAANARFLFSHAGTSRVRTQRSARQVVGVQTDAPRRPATPPACVWPR